MVKTILLYNKGFKWFTSESISAKGYLFDSEDNYYEEEKLINYFSNIENINQFKQKIENANGVFSVVVRINDITCIACDKSRFFPLYYSKHTDGYVFSDIPYELMKLLGDAKVDEVQSAIFKSTGYTIGSKTLVKGINEVPAAEYLVIEENNVKESGSFFSYASKKVSDDLPYETLKEKGRKAFEQAFMRLMTSLKGRQVALPLSGGYDSRLIAAMLKKFGYTDVVCFTYGRKNNFELQNSKTTAERLGYKWIFVEYNQELIKDYYDTSQFKDYALFAGKISSMPYMQEYFAVKYLKEKNLIKNNAVFIPGHSGDVLGGSQFIKVFNSNIEIEELSEHYFKTKFNFSNIQRKYKKSAFKVIEDRFKPYDRNGGYVPYSIFEDVDIKEKSAKHIINSAAVFDYFGHQMRIPYWDNKIMGFFKSVPAKYKIAKMLFDDILKSFYFEDLDLCLEKELQPKYYQMKIQQFKDLFKGFLPKYLRIKLLIKSDWMYYYEITKPMGNEITFNYKNISSFNAVITNWYVSFMKNRIRQIIRDGDKK
ncbi:asparagine synthase C-terminal domain-containing protein [Alkalitalea saponilacus]|uniref:asparagine synthase (glutamine-hydrolyzing) n=1 Tax=Alkalitalea saponilacus TaxID=889453 RepID=A0A1T5DI18_9BACT|nr:asparagine synthase C-terminal domain-containing protein [Alkalitalea saponilacus]ASB50703.1 asparagine synthase [Alkalitalea saponilacus]SKB71316.1 asparagine synthase (glutamine-hydrolysing) [Alkalitalea saponilacus]